PVDGADRLVAGRVRARIGNAPRPAHRQCPARGASAHRRAVGVRGGDPRQPQPVHPRSAGVVRAVLDAVRHRRGRARRRARRRAPDRVGHVPRLGRGRPGARPSSGATPPPRRVRDPLSPPRGQSVKRSAFEREAALARLADESFDVLVVGGGITGAGVALDAAGRGLRTALVERDDFASGTSSKSSKLVHGGLRYLQQREFRLVYEALAERQRLLHNAPHLVRALPFLIPIFGRDGVVNRAVARAYATALWMYDLTGGARIGKLHDRISVDEARAHMPSLRA